MLRAGLPVRARRPNERGTASMPADFSVQPAIRDDVPQIALLLAGLLRSGSDPDVDADRRIRGIELLLSRPSGARVLAAHAGGRVIGTASAQLAVSTLEGALSAWIENVIVAADWRGRDVGRALLAALLDWARANRATRAQLLLDPENGPADRFYARHGWQSTQLGVRRLMLAT